MFHQLRVDGKTMSRFWSLPIIVGLPLLIICGRFVRNTFPGFSGYHTILEMVFMVLLPIFGIFAACALFSDNEGKNENGFITRPVAGIVWYGSKIFTGLLHILIFSVWNFFLFYLFTFYEKFQDIQDFSGLLINPLLEPGFYFIIFTILIFIWAFKIRKSAFIWRLLLFAFTAWFCIHISNWISAENPFYMRGEISEIWLSNIFAAVYLFGLSTFFTVWLKKSFESLLTSFLIGSMSYLILLIWFPAFKIWVIPGGLGVCFVLAAYQISFFHTGEKKLKFKKAAVHFGYGLGFFALFILIAHIKGHTMNLHDTVLGISRETESSDTYFARTIQSPAGLFWFPWKLRGYQKIITDRTNYEETIPAMGENGKHFFLLSSDRKLWQPQIRVHIYQNEDRFARKKGEFALPFIFFPKDWTWFRYDINNHINSIWDLGADGSELWTLSAFNANTGQLWLQNEKAQVKTWDPEKKILESLEEHFCFIPTEPDTGIGRLDKAPYMFIQEKDSTKISLQKTDGTILLEGKKAGWLIRRDSFKPRNNTLLSFSGQAINSVYNIPHITISSIEFRHFNLHNGNEKSAVFNDISVSTRYPQYFFVNGVFHGLRYNNEHKNYDLLKMDEKGIAEHVYSISTGSDSRSVDKMVLVDDSNVIICAKNWYDKPEDSVWQWLDMAGRKIYKLQFNRTAYRIFEQKNNRFEAIFLRQRPGRKSRLSRQSVPAIELISTTTEPDAQTGGEK
jgi:hypothetical protein